MTDTVTLEGKPITVGEPVHFDINEMAVDQEMCQAGSILRHYGSLSAELSAQAATAKARAEIKSTELSQQIRSSAKQSGEKITEGVVKERVLNSPEYQELLATYIYAERDYKKVENMYRILLKRCDVIIALTYKQRTEIQKNAF